MIYIIICFEFPVNWFDNALDYEWVFKVCNFFWKFRNLLFFSRHIWFVESLYQLTEQMFSQKCVLRRYGTWMTLSRDFRLLSQYCSPCWARTSYRRIYQKKTWQLTRHSSIKTIFCSYVVTLQVGTLRGFDYTVITLIQTCVSIQYPKSFSRLSLVLDKNAEHQVWLTNAVCLLYSCIQGQQASIQFCFNRLLSPRPDGLNYWGNLLFYE